jgi:uncharacterized protein YyaL (SSP411 family)
MPNRLANSTSPYLLQHANNPVDWHPWGEEALARARSEDKPIFLSIGYAACHWCHVMAHESFEDPQTAAFMNEHFVNIKVDREERPDLDGIYMQATTAMTGSGGWPMSVFLTPDLKPFYAGTYFPPVARYNMPSFQDLLAGLAKAWREQRDEITRVGGQVAGHLESVAAVPGDGTALTPEHLDAIASALVENYDWGYGGWGTAPKFPQPMTIEFLLRRAARRFAGRGTESIEIKENKEVAERHSTRGEVSPKELEAALHALKAMARGGMYDVAGGGFSRYSTDNFWRVPHFEKMLYDNAQLARAYLHAWQLTGDPFHQRIVEETLAFVSRELTHPEGGFYSSLDADSEGEEGKFYVWSLDEIRATLGQEAEFFIAAYGVTPKGNWEGKNVLQRALDDATLAAHFSLQPADIPAQLTRSHARLLAARAQRVRPGTDDKVLTAWNGLMLAAYAEAARVLGKEVYLNSAIRNAEFLLTAIRPGEQLRRAWRNGQTIDVVFLEDYASLILGLLELYQADFNPRWFSAAQELAAEMVERFPDRQNGGFFDTPADSQGLLLRPRDTQDNATPSGGALACQALLKLAAFSENGEYRDLAERALATVAGQALKYPTAYAQWLSAADFALHPVKQVALTGPLEDPALKEMLAEIRSAYRPALIVAASANPPPAGAPTLLSNRPQLEGRATAYVCEGFVCRLPVATLEALREQL